MMDYISLSELSDYLHFQAEDTFPALKDEHRLTMLAAKCYEHAEFCTCRDDSGQLVGMIAFYANQPETGIAYIPHIYVSPAYRGRGISQRAFHYRRLFGERRSFLWLRKFFRQWRIEVQCIL